MKLILIFLLAIFGLSIAGLWLIHSGELSELLDSQLIDFFDVLLQAFLSASILGLLFEIVIWNFGDNRIKNEVTKAKGTLKQLITTQNDALIKKIPMLTATNVRELSKLTPSDASDVVTRILRENCGNERVAASIARIAANVIQLDNRAVP